MSNLSGRTAVVTGASRGIGAAIAQALAAAGAGVVVNYNRSPGPAETVVKGIEAAGGKAVAVQADVADPAQVAAVIEASSCGTSRTARSHPNRLAILSVS